MKELHIITPVKDSIDSTLVTVKAVLDSHLTMPHTYTVYNDFSTPENTLRLEQAAADMGFRLVNLSDLTQHPSPNYLLVLQRTQREAIEADAALCIVESDVVVNPDTLQKLYDGALQHSDCGIAASVTVDDEGEIKVCSRLKSIAVFAVRCLRPNFCVRSLLPNLILKRIGST